MTITVQYGANTYPNLVFESDADIGDVREEVSSLLGLDSDAEAIVRGIGRDNSYNVAHGDVVTFRKRTGEKG